MTGTQITAAWFVFGSMLITQNPTLPSRRSSLPATVQNRVVMAGSWEAEQKTHSGRWEISTPPGRAGLQIAARVDDVEKQFELLSASTFGHVSEFVAKALPLQHELILVLGISHLETDGNSISYRLIVHRTWKGEPTDERWWISAPLVTRPLEHAFDGMSILFPGGDSVALGLHELVRGGGEYDRIESHFFVDHCPMGHYGGLYHYTSMVDEGEPFAEWIKQENGGNGGQK